jgi:hypothetical protein
MFISVLGVLNVEKLCAHVFTFVRGVAKLCVLVFVCTGRSKSRENLRAYFIFVQAILKCSIPRLFI